MHRKSFTIKAPLDAYAVPLELFLSDVATTGLQSASGEYVGDGKASHTITTPFSPLYIVTSPKINLSTSTVLTQGMMTFSLADNVGATWIPASGLYDEYSCFIKNGVIAINNNSFVVGNHNAINKENVTYLYFIVG